MLAVHGVHHLAIILIISLFCSISEKKTLPKDDDLLFQEETDDSYCNFVSLRFEYRHLPILFFSSESFNLGFSLAFMERI
jgi:hypothetical protein